MITDTHCHLASHRFEDSEVPQLVENARNRGVKRMICIGTDVNDSAKGIQ